MYLGLLRRCAPRNDGTISAEQLLTEGLIAERTLKRLIALTTSTSGRGVWRDGCHHHNGNGVIKDDTDNLRF